MLVELLSHKHNRTIADAIRRLTLLCLVCLSLSAAHFAWSSVSCSCEEKCDPFCVEDVIDDCFDEGEEEDGGPPTGRPVARGSVSVAPHGAENLTVYFRVRLTSEGERRIGTVRSASINDPIAVDLYINRKYVDTAYITEFLPTSPHSFAGDVIFNRTLPPGLPAIEARVSSPNLLRVESTAGRAHFLKPRKGTARSDPIP